MKFGENLNSTEEYLPFSYNAEMIRLDANECCFNVTDNMKKDISEIVSELEFNRYPDAYCSGLRKAYANFYGIDAENTVVGNGSDELISIIFSSLIPINSKILVTTPDFSMYSFYATLYGRTVEFYGKENDVSVNIDSLIEKINSGSFDFVIFSNPCNPTGQALSRREILQIVKNVTAMVCVDEAYMDFWNNNEESVIKDIESFNNLIVLRTLSKAIGLASCRLGFVAANKNIISMFNKARSPYNVNAISQAVGEYILKNREYLIYTVEKIKIQTSFLSNKLMNLNIKNFDIFPSKTNFVFAKSPAADTLYKKLLKKNIVVRCIGPNYLRITSGTNFEILALTSALKEITYET